MLLKILASVRSGCFLFERSPCSRVGAKALQSIGRLELPLWLCSRRRSMGGANVSDLALRATSTEQSERCHFAECVCRQASNRPKAVVGSLGAELRFVEKNHFRSEA